jgi:hypothetical protein
MCESEICPCKWHSTKIKADFFDIFEGIFTPQEEQQIAINLWHEWNEGRQ